jgi:hypothetical protein
VNASFTEKTMYLLIAITINIVVAIPTTAALVQFNILDGFNIFNVMAVAWVIVMMGAFATFVKTLSPEVMNDNPDDERGSK